MKKFFENKPRAWFVIGSVFIVLLTIAALVIGYYYNQNSDVVAWVGSEKITQSDLDKTLYGLNFDNAQTYDDATKELLLNRLIERKIVALEADSLGLTVSEEEIDTAIEERIGAEFTTYTDEQKAQTRNTVRESLLIDKAKAKMTSSADVTYLVARFDRARQEYEKGWETKVAADKVYAETLINSVYDQLLSGKLTVDSAKKLLDSDKRVGPVAWKVPDNMVFSEELSIKNTDEIYLAPSLATETLKLNEGLNTPKLATVSFQEDGDTMESFYYIASIKNLVKSDPDYDTWLSGKMDEYNVRSIYENK